MTDATHKVLTADGRQELKWNVVANGYFGTEIPCEDEFAVERDVVAEVELKVES